MPVRKKWRSAIPAAVIVAGCSALPAWSQTQTDVATAPTHSQLDSQLMQQLLIGEIEARRGQTAAAVQLLLDAARRTREEALFRRATEIALQGRSAEQALLAVQAWRRSLPESLDALRTQLQIDAALNRSDDIQEPLRALLARTPEAERGALIALLPRLLQRMPDRRRSAQTLDAVLAPYAEREGTRVAALVASGRAWLLADDADEALAQVRRAQVAEPQAPGPALLALELMAQRPQAEELVRAYLQAGNADPALRMAYARALMGSQRLADAAAELEQAIRDRPDAAPPRLALGALQLELRQPQAAQATLQRYLELVEGERRSAGDPTQTDEEEAPDGDERVAQGRTQAWLMLSQAAEQLGQYDAAEAWLAHVSDPQRALEVQSRRASLLARQGRLDQARTLLHDAPERDASDARIKLLTEASLLRDARRWEEAFQVLGDAAARFPDDPDLLYEQAMMAEKLGRTDEMEQLLRRVIEIKPDNAHAHNALGYSLADRGLRLPEARRLVQRALELAPGDPFITDSLGWVEYRQGNLEEALRLLRQAYASRPDAEIGAHLGEVLWALGRRDEARRVWTESRGRDAGNDVLRETLARLKVEL
ncbi:MAG TPA: tetratricopeptide repeat protein [Rubrivivax sp.]|nr:tetratricopeptide repeat protein [Rubrivivax sp.]